MHVAIVRLLFGTLLGGLLLGAAFDAHAQNGTITGRVTDSGSGAGIPGSLLLLFDATTFDQVDSATANASGDYSLAGPAANYLVVAGAAGYGTELYDNVPCPNLVCDPGSVTVVPITSGANTPNIDFALDPLALISGTVVTVDSQPLSGVEILLEALDGTAVGGTTTGVDGSYSVDVEPGAYRVRTSNATNLVDELYDDVPCPYGTCDRALGATVSVASGQQVTGIDFTLAPGGSIAGEVTDSSGAPIAATVSIFNAQGSLLVDVAASGGYSASGLPAGSYAVRFVSDGYDSELFDDVACPGGTCDPTAGDPVVVAPPLASESIDAQLSGDGPPPPPMVAYINRCAPNGCTVRSGAESSINNTSSIIAGTRILSAYAHGDESFDALVACVREVFVRYPIEITTIDPGNVVHREHMVGGTPAQLGFNSGTAGVAPASCGAGLPSSISFTFANAIGNDIFELCWTVTHEIGHQFGLEHELHAPDAMSYIDNDDKRFTPVDAPCGEGQPQAACQCGGVTQNSDAHLSSVIGVRQQLFDDGFEGDEALGAWRAYATQRGVRNAGPPGVCATDFSGVVPVAD